VTENLECSQRTMILTVLTFTVILSSRHVFNDIAMPSHVKLGAAAAIALRNVVESQLIPNTNLMLLSK